MSKTESRDKLEQIRKIRSRSNQSNDEVEMYQCPIDGCDRTVIGDVGPLQNHVANTEDDLHRHKTLNEDLGIILDIENCSWEELERWLTE